MVRSRRHCWYTWTGRCDMRGRLQPASSGVAHAATLCRWPRKHSDAICPQQVRKPGLADVRLMQEQKWLHG